MKLSICITTLNRGAFIGATLDSILDQLNDDCEVVVLDGGSTDNTAGVMAEYVWRYDRVRYVRQETNHGFDRDCDRAVELASGEYCWLAPDDDLFKPGAVATVLQALRNDPSLVVTNVEFRDFTMTRVVQNRWLSVTSDRSYGPDELDRLFVEVGADRWKYLGGIIVKRSIWLARDRARYYGSWFMFIGAIFQERLPGHSVVIAEPLISYRLDNTHAWARGLFEIVWIKWPEVIASLALSTAARRKVCPDRWADCEMLVFWRGMGLYSREEYRRWIRPQLSARQQRWIPALIAILPGVLVHAALVLYYSMTSRPYQEFRQPRFMLHELRGSRYHVRNWRVLARASGIARAALMNT